MTALAFRPTGAEIRHVAGLVGRVLLGVGVLFLPAIAAAGLAREWNDLTALLIGGSLTVLAGAWLSEGVDTDRELAWAEGMVTVALAWLAAPVPIAVTLLLSGNVGSMLDGYFDGMSGLTTSGLTLMQDVDHAGAGIQLLRHLMHFAGGQGIILVVLMLLATGGPHVGTLLAGEGREERLAPNAVRTARLVYAIAAVWGIVGTAVLWVVLQVVGLSPLRSLLHALSLFMAAFDTGGFSIPSTSIAYYHSGLLEGVLIIFMIAGALSFPLHHQLWQRHLRSAASDLDLRTFVVTTTALTGLILVALGANEVYDGVVALTRKGAFTLVSAATGTGFAVVSGQTYDGWGDVAPAAVVVAMALGAMAGSTAGGVKAVRVGLVVKSVLRDIRAALTAESAVVHATYHARRDRIITDEQVAGAVIITALFALTYVGGALVAVYHGATLEAGLFESTSATATVGLTVGITSPSAPLAIKLVTIAQMWLGRLEFLSAFALVAWVMSAARGQATRMSRARQGSAPR